MGFMRFSLHEGDSPPYRLPSLENMGKAVYPGEGETVRALPAPSPRFILFSSLARVAQLREGFAVEDLKGTPGKVPQNAPIAQGPDNAAYRAPMQAEHKGQLGLRHAGG